MASGGSSSQRGQPAKSNTNSKGGKSTTFSIPSVTRIMRKALPVGNAWINEDAKEIVRDCAVEFIAFINLEANEHRKSEHRQTITAEDIIWAFSYLGYHNYAHSLTRYYQRLQADKAARMLPPLPTIHAQGGGPDLGPVGQDGPDGASGSGHASGAGVEEGSGSV